MKKKSICIFLCNAKIVECENEDFRFEENLSIPCYKIKKNCSFTVKNGILP